MSNINAKIKKGKESCTNTDVCKLHLVKKDGTWVKVPPTTNKLPVQSLPSVLHQNKKEFDILCPSQKTRNLVSKQTNTRKHSPFHNTSSNERSLQPSLTGSREEIAGQSSGDDILEQCLIDSVSNSIRTRGDFTPHKACRRILSTAEIRSELELTPKRVDTDSSSPSPVYNELSPSSGLHCSNLHKKIKRAKLFMDCSPIKIQSVFQKTIRSNTKENSPIKENRIKQLDMHHLSTGVNKYSIGLDDAPVSENSITVSYVSVSSEKLIDTTSCVENSISQVMCGKRARHQESNKRLKRTFEGSDSSNIEEQIKYSHLGSNIEECDECSPSKLRAASNVIKIENQSYPVNQSVPSVCFKHIQNDDTSNKQSLHGASIGSTQGKVSVDALSKTEELQIVYSSSYIHKYNDTASQVNSEDVTQSHTDTSADQASGSERKSGSSSSEISDIIYTGLPDTTGLINLDQLYQDLSGIPMVQLEKLSAKTLLHYYGINVQSMTQNSSKIELKS